MPSTSPRMRVTGRNARPVTSHVVTATSSSSKGTAAAKFAALEKAGVTTV